MIIKVEKVVRMAELEIEPTHISAYTALLAEEIEASVANEAGVLMLHAVTIKGNPGQVRILEVYASREAYDAHLKTTHFLRYKAATADMVKSLHLLELDPIVMRAK